MQHWRQVQESHITLNRSLSPHQVQTLNYAAINISQCTLVKSFEERIEQVDQAYTEGDLELEADLPGGEKQDRTLRENTYCDTGELR